MEGRRRKNEGKVSMKYEVKKNETRIAARDVEDSAVDCCIDAFLLFDGGHKMILKVKEREERKQEREREREREREIGKENG